MTETEEKPKEKVMPRRGMGVEINEVCIILVSQQVMPRRGMGVEITNCNTAFSSKICHAPQGHGSRNLNLAKNTRSIASCPAGAWE